MTRAHMLYVIVDLALNFILFVNNVVYSCRYGVRIFKILTGILESLFLDVLKDNLFFDSARNQIHSSGVNIYLLHGQLLLE